MKALLCTLCYDIRALDPNGAWIACRCGNLEARWVNPALGTVRVRAKDKGHARIMGFNNQYLRGGSNGPTHTEMVKAGGQWEWWQQLHESAIDAPGYIFNKDKRACWATIVKVNETNDITWEPDVSP